jgi:small subunit ribosomal protein S2
LSKRERLQVNRQREKLERDLGSIADMNRLPAAIFIVDTIREHIAVSEARKLNIPTFAMVDTNSNPQEIDYAIPANDDASKSIEKIMAYVTEAVKEGLETRKADRDKSKQEKLEKKAAQVGE